MKNLGLASLFLFTIAIAVHYHVNHEFQIENMSTSQLLYLPAGKYLKSASFGYDSLVSDFVYLWSIQYFGEVGLPQKYQHLKHTYDIITELDPLYLDPYYTGALFMFHEGHNPQGGLALLDKGLKKNPTEWMLPMDAGFYCMFNLKDKNLAVQYFEKASRVPGAQSMPKRILASLRFKMGDKQTAFLLWKEVYENETRPSIKQTAYQNMFELRVLLDLDYMRTGIQNFYYKFGRYPRSLNQMVVEDVLSGIPNDPDGNPYQYDSQTGTVRYTKLKLYKKYEE